MFSIEKNVSPKKSKVIVVPWTLGLSVLPLSGGMLDQPYRLMEIFNVFIAGERQAAQDSMNKN